MWWVLLGFSILIFSYLGNEKYNKNKSYLFFRVLLILSMSILPGFGGMVSTDHPVYVLRYLLTDWDTLNVLQDSFEVERSSIEIGYELLNRLGNLLTLGVPGFFYVVSCIMNTFLVIVSFRFPAPGLSLLFFVISGYYFQEANLVRQFLAIAVVLYSLKYIVNRDIVRYLVGCTVAVTFHTSAVIFFPFVLFAVVDMMKYYQKLIVILFCFWIITFLFPLGFINPQSLLAQLINLGILSNMYDNYLTVDQTVGGETELSIIFLFNLCFTLLVFLLKPVKNHIYLIFCIIGSILTNISFAIPSVWRLSLYFMVLFSLSIPYICCSQNKYLIIKNNAVRILYVSYALYASYLFLFRYIFEEPDLGSKMYPISMFFK